MGGECDGGFLSCAHREARSGFSLLIGTNRVQYFSLESQGCGTSTPVWCGSPPSSLDLHVGREQRLDALDVPVTVSAGGLVDLEDRGTGQFT